MEEVKTPSQLPKPCGFRVLVAIPKSKETFDSGIVKSDMTKIVEESGAIWGYVVKLGPDAYADQERFPNGPYCKEGDIVLVGAHRGNRFMIHSQEFRMLNDDQIEATIEDPSGYRRI